MYSFTNCNFVYLLTLHIYFIKYFVLIFQAMIFNKYDYAHFENVFKEAASVLVDLRLYVYTLVLALRLYVYTSVIVSM